MINIIINHPNNWIITLYESAVNAIETVLKAVNYIDNYRL